MPSKPKPGSPSKPGTSSAPKRQPQGAAAPKTKKGKGVPSKSQKPVRGAPASPTAAPAPSATTASPATPAPPVTPASPATPAPSVAPGPSVPPATTTAGPSTAAEPSKLEPDGAAMTKNRLQGVSTPKTTKGKEKGKGKEAKRGKDKGKGKEAKRGKDKGKGKEKGKEIKPKKGKPVSPAKPGKSEPPITALPSTSTAAATQGPPESKKNPVRLSKLTGKDIIVITALWSCEIVYTLTEAVKSSFLLEEDETGKNGGKEKKDITFLGPIKAIRISLLVLTLLTIGAVALLADGGKKITYIFVGLFIYLVTPLFGLLATNFNILGSVDLMLLLEFGWNSVSSLRYWLIFHQKSPLSVIQTRSIVTYNELLNDFVDYITVVWVTLKPFSPILYNILWSVVLILMFLWLGMVSFVKRWLNRDDDKMEVKRKLYEDSEMVDSFNARQTTKHLVLFLSLIFPSMMFPMQRSTVTFIFWQLRNELPVFFLYRFDLVISLVCFPIVTGILIALFRTRQEMRDLFAIGIAHFFNISVSVIFLVLIMKNQSANSNQADLSRYTKDGDVVVLPQDTVLTIFLYTSYKYKNLTVVHENLDEAYKWETIPGIKIAPASNGSTIKVSGKFQDGETVFDRNFTVTQNEGYYLTDRGELVKIQNFCQHFRSMPLPEPKIAWVQSNMESCSKGEGPRYSEEGTRFRSDVGCHTISIYMTVTEVLTGRKILDDQSIFIPLMEDESRTHFTVGIMVKTQWSPNIIIDGKPYPIQYTANIPADSMAYLCVIVAVLYSNGVILPELLYIPIDRYVFEDPPTKPEEIPTTAVQTVSPSTIPSTSPSTIPTTTPKTIPTTVPTTTPRTVPATTPRTVPATTPTTVPTTTPTTVPTTTPTTVPTTTPTTVPATTPRTVPTAIPPTSPTIIPTTFSPKIPSTNLPDSTNWPSRHTKLITSGLSVGTVAIGIASASYIHFIWIQCPSNHRVLILAVFFAGNYFGTWFPVMLLSGLKMTEFAILLSFQLLGGVWHLISSVFFYRNLRKLNDEEKPYSLRMQF